MGKPDIYCWPSGSAKDWKLRGRHTLKAFKNLLNLIQLTGILINVLNRAAHIIMTRAETSYSCVFWLWQIVVASDRKLSLYYCTNLYYFPTSNCDNIPASKMCFYNDKMCFHSNKWSPHVVWIKHLQNVVLYRAVRDLLQYQSQPSYN